VIRARQISAAVLLTFIFAAGSAFASWYDDYDAGIAACNKGQWAVAAQKMTSAINGHPKESDHERTYGAIFISYHPYYYRGVAYLNSGKFEQAIADFEKTSGPGDTNLGALDALMSRAKTKLEAASAPANPEPQPQIAQRPAPVPVAPAPVPLPAGPSIDPALRQRVQAAIAAASSSLGNARNRKAAGAPQYSQGVSALADANAKANTARSNDDLNAALASAQNAALFADSAMAPGAPPSARPPVAIAQVVTPRPVAAADMALSDYKSQLRRALSSYFAGEFDSAASGFESLTKSMPNNGWVWAFLGASRYSQYAFEADDNYKQKAVEAFKRAKTSPTFKGGLPERYFSKRIRKFFATLG
jgi:tetratricopeptide (TPR) repeat protein